MEFVSLAFLALYLVALITRMTLGRRGSSRGYVFALCLLGLLFYAWKAPNHLGILLMVVLVGYLCGRLLESARSTGNGSPALLLGISITLVLGILGYFKYGAMAYGMATGNQSLPGFLRVMLPVAISFYTFQAISYCVDVYRGVTRAERDWAAFLLYLGFFPQLVAGPIVRAREFLYQVGRHRRPRLRVFLWGGYLIIRGFFLKLVVADNLDHVVSGQWHSLGDPGAPLLLLVALPALYAVQLLCDFMAYTDIARGVAYQLGFRLPENFRSPYIAATFADFWHRWHITLSAWFRDYLYKPLGGSRKGILRTARNILIVFLLSGLWHGANLTFVVWGLLLGMALGLERLVVHAWTDRLPGGSRRLPGWALMRVGWYLFVQGYWAFSMIFFRSVDLQQATDIVINLVDALGAAGDVGAAAKPLQAAGILTLPIVLMHVRAWGVEKGRLPAAGPREYALYAGIMSAMILTMYAQPRSFIYFQF